MPSSSRSRSRRTCTVLGALAVTGGLVASGCSSGASGDAGTATSSASTASATTASATSSASTKTAVASTASGATFLSSATIHEISMTFDQATYAQMLATYAASGDKEWIEVTVVIDGKTYASAGARLKGNSSLRGAATGSTAPESLPWLIRLDKFVDGQNHNGLTELVVRGNSTQTSLNEAVALDLLREAGLASEQAALVRLTVNGGAADLRLVIENLGDEWQDANFESDGILYKAESSGDYSYRGTDPAAYVDVFEQESGKNDNLTPLIELLDFVNNSDDATFAAELSKHLDVEAFAKYLAYETLIDNFDDIDGPGNNSYLFWDESTNRFTVVAWDHNLAFGSRPGGAGGAGGAPGGRAAGGVQVPAGGAGGAGARAGGPGGKANALVTRFNSVAAFSSLVTKAKADLTATLFTDGTASASLRRWSELIQTSASDLVPAATLTSEVAAIQKYAVP